MLRIRLVAYVMCMWVVLAATGDAVCAPRGKDSYKEGLAALKKGNVPTALELFTSAVAAAPGNHELYNDRGVAYKRMGEIDSAIADYSKALDIKADYVPALNNRGVALVQKGDFGRAVSDFREALKYGHLGGKVHSNLGIALTKSGEHAAALVEYEAARAQGKMDPESMYFFAESQEKTGALAAALDTLKQARAASKDAGLHSVLDKKIAALQESMPKPEPPKTAPVESRMPVTPAAPLPTASNAKEKPAPTNNPALDREVVLSPPRAPSPVTIAAPKPMPTPAPVPAAPPNPVSNLESVQALEEASRSRIVSKLMPAAQDIYAQGRKFFEEKDYAKALVRFEDVLQLEKRNKQPAAVAWCLLEIGRSLALLGDRPKAESSLIEALKAFEKLHADDEAVLTLYQLGAVKKASDPERARAHFAAAEERARLKGYKFAEELGSGGERKAPVATPTTAERKPRETPARAVPQPRPTVEPTVERTAGPVVKFRWGAETVAAHAPSPEASPQQSGPKSEPAAAPEGRRASLGRIAQPAQSAGALRHTGQDVISGPVPPRSPKPEPPITGVAPVPDQQTFASVNSPKTDSVGVGPGMWGNSVKLSVPTGDIARAEPDKVQGKRTAREERRVTAPPDDRKSLRMELSELRRLRDAQDEMGMIAALERISEILVRLGEKEKALHALGASIAFREKHGITASSEKPYLRSGELKEQFGDLSGALEDYARTYYRANELKQEAPRVRAHELFRNLAVKMKLAADESIEQFVRLCRARALSDSTAETEALLRLANLYEKAGRPRDAGAYYERSSAAMLTDRARIQEQLGNGETARKFYDEAMETLRKLDYGRYLEFKHKGRGTQKFSGAQGAGFSAEVIAPLEEERGEVARY